MISSSRAEQIASVMFASTHSRGRNANRSASAARSTRSSSSSVRNVRPVAGVRYGADERDANLRPRHAAVPCGSQTTVGTSIDQASASARPWVSKVLRNTPIADSPSSRR